MGFASAAVQVDFWVGLRPRLEVWGLKASSPSPRNYCYVSIGSAAAKVVLTAPTADGGIACKFALNRSVLGGSGTAWTVFKRLAAERELIEAEMGFDDLDWGSRNSDTRIYRYRALDITSRSEWPTAHAWLGDTAASFARVIGPCLSALLDRQDVRTPAGGLAARPIGPVLRAAQSTQTESVQRVERGVTQRSDSTCEDWVDDRLRRFAAESDLELWAGHFADGDRWCGIYSRETPEPVYRYAFGQWWGAPDLDHTVAWILLNPATGDTDGRPRPVRSYCRNRSKDWGYTGFVILNLFAYRDRDPSQLIKHQAIGPYNDRALSVVTTLCARTVAAWGTNGANWDRASTVRLHLPTMFCLPKRGQTLTANGQPFYPRGLSTSAAAVPLPSPGTDPT